jgi:hypothetical protein
VPPLIDDPAYWRNRAKEIRTLADDMLPKSKQKMLEIAESCERFARQAEERLPEQSSKP